MVLGSGYRRTIEQLRSVEAPMWCKEIWGGRWDSNAQPPAWESSPVDQCKIRSLRN
jgi:hypothetical protein